MERTRRQLQPETGAAPPALFPYLSYRDAAAALDWLAEAFGFVKTVAFQDDAGTVMHAEMTCGHGAIMLGASTGPQPAEAGASGELEHGIYVYVEDVDAHYRQAQAAGAEIVFPPEDSEWGTRRYRVRDPEGYEWSFGNYRPATAT